MAATLRTIKLLRCPLNNKGWWLGVSTEKTFSPVEAEEVSGISLLSDFPLSATVREERLFPPKKT